MPQLTINIEEALAESIAQLAATRGIQSEAMAADILQSSVANQNAAIERHAVNTLSNGEILARTNENLPDGLVDRICELQQLNVNNRITPDQRCELAALVCSYDKVVLRKCICWTEAVHRKLVDVVPDLAKAILHLSAKRPSAAQLADLAQFALQPQLRPFQNDARRPGRVETIAKWIGIAGLIIFVMIAGVRLYQQISGPSIQVLKKRIAPFNFAFADRIDAVHQLGALGPEAADKEIIEQLCEIVENPNEDNFIRAAAAITLGRIGDFNRGREAITKFKSTLPEGSIGFKLFNKRCEAAIALMDEHRKKAVK